MWTYPRVHEEATEMMVGMVVSWTCGGDENVSPELVLRLQAPVDHRFDNL